MRCSPEAELVFSLRQRDIESGFTELLAFKQELQRDRGLAGPRRYLPTRTGDLQPARRMSHRPVRDPKIAFFWGRMASIMEFSCLGRSCKGAKLETDAVRSQTLAKRNKQVQSENLG